MQRVVNWRCMPIIQKLLTRNSRPWVYIQRQHRQKTTKLFSQTLSIYLAEQTGVKLEVFNYSCVFFLGSLLLIFQFSPANVLAMPSLNHGQMSGFHLLLMRTATSPSCSLFNWILMIGLIGELWQWQNQFGPSYYKANLVWPWLPIYMHRWTSFVSIDSICDHCWMKYSDEKKPS